METVRLLYKESVRLDAERLAGLYANLGENKAETLICDAIEDMAVRLVRIQRQHREGHLAEMARTAQGMSNVAGHVGMMVLARVSADVATCAALRDRTALAAVTARLVRVADRSLSAIWDPQQGDI